MRPVGVLALVAALTASSAGAAGLNRIYLVPALRECPGPASCVPRQFESPYTFDSIILFTPAARYMPIGKPSLIVDVRGVRDASHALVNDHLTLRLLAGRVSLPSLGTFPDDSPLVQTAPVTIPLRNGRGKAAYKSSVAVPNGLITNGGGVEIFDPQGNRLAVTGSQSRP